MAAIHDPLQTVQRKWIKMVIVFPIQRKSACFMAGL